MISRSSLVASLLMACSSAMKIKQEKALSDSLLAQQEAHTCSSAHDRVKAGPADLATIDAGSEPYTDASFGFEDAVRWDDMPAKHSLAYIEAELFWKRISETFPSSDGYSLWGQSGITPDDIQQGEIGNCWLLSATSAVAENAGALQSVFVNEDYSEAGIYGLTVYVLGYPVTITVDDYLPWHMLNGWYEYNPFMSAGPDKSIWGVLVEKALAKLTGSYESLIGGDPTEGVRYLTGAPGIDIDHKNIDQAFKDDLWAKINQGETQGAYMTSNSNKPKQNGHVHDESGVGICASHAYSLLKPLELSDGTRLLKMRNPWGTENYKGPWSDESDLWTDQFKKEAGWVNENDGSFFMDLDTYLAEFKDTGINYNTDSKHRSSFLVLDDKGETPGYLPWCGAKCSLNQLVLTSDVDQDIIISAHTWPKRTYPASCISKDPNAGNNNMRITGVEEIQHWTYGSLDVFTRISAGQQIIVDVEIDWTREGITKDFSVVVFGDDAPVTITHGKGLESAPALPVLSKE